MAKLKHRKITVAHVVTSLRIGGMETVIANIARNIDHDLFSLLVICVFATGPIGKELSKKGIKVIQLPKMTKIISFLYPPCVY